MRELAIGVVGCGYVADFYLRCLRSEVPAARVAGVYDVDRSRARSAVGAYGGAVYPSLPALLDEPGLDVVLNLTPPDAHANITEAALLAGKHVFSEKPLATDLARGIALLELARERGLALGGAPSVHRSRAARTMRRLVRGRAIGELSHIYCDLDDGPIHRMSPEEWLSPRGVPWPIHDEFRTGPVVHHLPYALNWAVLLAGPVVSATGFTRTSVPVKYGVPSGPDLCVATLEHATGALTRVTVGALASRRRELVVVGTEGELRLPDMWSVDGPVLLGDDEVLGSLRSWPYHSTHRLNLAQGLRDLASCLRRDPVEGGRLVTETYGALALHVLEIVLAMNRPGQFEFVTGSHVAEGSVVGGY